MGIAAQDTSGIAKPRYFTDPLSSLRALEKLPIWGSSGIDNLDYQIKLRFAINMLLLLSTSNKFRALNYFFLQRGQTSLQHKHKQS
jgi:hypothetical protein